MQLDLRVVELLCSRLCHDLISPVGAVNTGLELLGEHAVSVADEALDMVGRSAKNAAAKLDFFRLAFGFGGSTASVMGPAEVKRLCDGYFEGGRTTLDWPMEGQGDSPPIPRPTARLLLNMIMLAAECLPRGGSVFVHCSLIDEGLGLALAASGQGARIRTEHQAALSPNVDPKELSARTVQPYFAARLADDLGALIEIEDHGEGEVRFALVVADPIVS